MYKVDACGGYGYLRVKAGSIDILGLSEIWCKGIVVFYGFLFDILLIGLTLGRNESGRGGDLCH